jgi:PPM family protein phosphatase
MTTRLMSLQAGHAARSDTGRQREHNEDRYLARPPLFAVADGLGGRNAGEVAAQIAVDHLEAELGERRNAAGLRRALEALNTRIADAAGSGSELRGMSTTCVVLLLHDGQADVAHVGDSRAYLLRSGSLQRLTEDHTMVAELVRSGNLAATDAELDNRRHVLTQALGAVDQVQVATRTLDVQHGDRFLLCSDGLSGQVGDEEIRTVLVANGDPGLAADELVRRANAAGGIDNVTVVIVDPGGGASGLDDTRRYVADGGVRRRASSRRSWVLLATLAVLVIVVGALAMGLAAGAPTPSPAASPVRSGTESPVPSSTASPMVAPGTGRPGQAPGDGSGGPGSSPETGVDGGKVSSTAAP